MDPFSELCTKARQRRDRAIREARAAYRTAIEQIDQLRAELGGERPRKFKPANQPIVELICDLIPKNELFTVGEMVRWMQEREPDREFNVPTIRTFFPRLAEQGIIHKVSRNGSGHVLWAAAGVSVEDTPFGALPMTDVAEQVLRECGPMRLSELVVEMQRRGYRPSTEPRRLMASLRATAHRTPGRFKRGKDGRWEVRQGT